MKEGNRENRYVSHLAIQRVLFYPNPFFLHHRIGYWKATILLFTLRHRLMKLAVFECNLTCFLLFIDGCRVGMLVVCGLSDHQPRYCYLKIRENNVTSHVHEWLFCYSWQFTVLYTVALVMPMSLSPEQMLDILQTACAHSSGVKFHFSQVDGRERPQHFTSPHAVARPTHASAAWRAVSCIGPMCYLGHNTSTYKTNQGRWQSNPTTYVH